MATTKRATPNLPVNYEAQMAKEAAEIAKRIAAPSGDRIKFNGNSSISTPDGNEGEALECVVIDFVSANLFYEGAFDRNSPQPPGCFAIGTEPSMMVPSDNSPDKQAESCSICPNNQFGSAGKGKACKNTRLLAVMPLSMDGDTPPIWIMSVPPTSMKMFDGYVSSLAVKHKMSPIGMLTEITLDQGVTYAAPRFKAVRPLKAEEFKTYMEQREAAMTRLTVEPDVSQFNPASKSAPAGRGGVPVTTRRGAR